MADIAGAGSLPRGWDAHVHVFDADAPMREGHYVPATRSLAEIEAVAATHGIGHLVLVQPSVYGTDNSVMLRALGQQPGRHRGVAVVAAGVSDTELDELHAAGVRGVRFNAVSPVGNGERDLPVLAGRLAERQWHAQWYVRSQQLRHLVQLQRRTGLVFVIDHLAGIGANVPQKQAHWDALAELAAQGAWLKLSGWYRLGCSEPYGEMIPQIERAAALFGDRLVWGSDWPHTSLPPEAAPPYAGLLEPVRRALGDARTQAIMDAHPQVLYGENAPG